MLCIKADRIDIELYSCVTLVQVPTHTNGVESSVQHAYFYYIYNKFHYPWFYERLISGLVTGEAGQGSQSHPQYFGKKQ